MLYTVNSTSKTFERTTTDTSKSSLMIRNEGAYAINFTLTESGHNTTFTLKPDAQVFLAIREDSLSAVSSGETAFRTYKVTAKGVDECDINGIVPSDAVAEELKELEDTVEDLAGTVESIGDEVSAIERKVVDNGVDGIEISGLQAFYFYDSIYSYGEDQVTPLNSKKMTIITNAKGSNQNIFSYVEPASGLFYDAQFSLQITSNGLITYGKHYDSEATRYSDATVQSTIVPKADDQIAFVYDAGTFNFYVNGELGATAPIPAEEGNVFNTEGIRVQYGMLDAQKLKYFIWDEYRAWAPDDFKFTFSDLLAGKTIPLGYRKDNTDKDFDVDSFDTNTIVSGTSSTVTADETYGTATDLIKVVPANTGSRSRNITFNKTNYMALSNAVVTIKGYFPSTNTNWKFASLKPATDTVAKIVPISNNLDENNCFAATSTGEFEVSFYYLGLSTSVSNLPNLQLHFRNNSGKGGQSQSISDLTKDVFYIKEYKVEHEKGIVQYVQAPTYANVWTQLGTYAYDLYSTASNKYPATDRAGNSFLSKTVTLQNAGAVYADAFGITGDFFVVAAIIDELSNITTTDTPTYFGLSFSQSYLPIACGDLLLAKTRFWDKVSLLGCNSTKVTFDASGAFTLDYTTDVGSSGSVKVTLLLERM